ncbi:transcriptional regulator, MarR family [Lachnospiraceae bacterium KM106-2]|nr:transcriptional regulator, MarR family [Lachnospiraceae bacterium KM106-2]
MGIKMDHIKVSMEELLFQFLDQSKFLFFPEQWNQTFMDYSKNEAFTLLLIYKNQKVNMTEIAEYLSVPLNTVTGIVGRLEKRKMIERRRDDNDKRIVVAVMTKDGQSFVKEQVELLQSYLNRVIETLSEEEIRVLFHIIDTTFQVLREDKSKSQASEKKVKKITIE